MTKTHKMPNFAPEHPIIFKHQERNDDLSNNVPSILARTNEPAHGQKRALSSAK